MILSRKDNQRINSSLKMFFFPMTTRNFICFIILISSVHTFKFPSKPVSRAPPNRRHKFVAITIFVDEGDINFL